MQTLIISIFLINLIYWTLYLVLLKKIVIIDGSIFFQLEFSKETALKRIQMYGKKFFKYVYYSLWYRKIILEILIPLFTFFVFGFHWISFLNFIVISVFKFSSVYSIQKRTVVDYNKNLYISIACLLIATFNLIFYCFL